MAGYANSKAKLATAEARITELESQLARYQAEERPKARQVARREYDEDIIQDLLIWSDEGQFLDECFAQWGIDDETWQQWLQDHVALRQAVGPARARARASLLKTLREALRNRTAFPVSLADRIIHQIEKEGGAAIEGADGLIRHVICPRCAAADAQSAEVTAQVIEQ